MNVEEDFNEFCREHLEADLELKIPGILKSMKLKLDDTIPYGMVTIDMNYVLTGDSFRHHWVLNY